MARGRNRVQIDSPIHNAAVKMSSWRDNDDDDGLKITLGPMDQIPDRPRPSQNVPEISEFRRRRKCDQGLPQSYFTVTALTELQH
jgi:hypothetical protein